MRRVFGSLRIYAIRTSATSTRLFRREPPAGKPFTADTSTSNAGEESRLETVERAIRFEASSRTVEAKVNLKLIRPCLISSTVDCFSWDAYVSDVPRCTAVHDLFFLGFHRVPLSLALSLFLPCQAQPKTIWFSIITAKIRIHGRYRRFHNFDSLTFRR